MVDLLPLGHYSARAEAEGMSPEISPVIRVEIGAAALLTFKLKVAGPKETITVSDAPRIVEMDPSALSALARVGIFYTRIPQIYRSAVTDNNGLSDTFLVPNQSYNVWSFATWPTSYGISCLYPACINTFGSSDIATGGNRPV